MPASRYAGFLGSDGAGGYNGTIQAFSYTEDGVDMKVFAHPLTRKNHQKDEYVLLASSIYDASTTDEKFQPNGSGFDAMLSVLQMLASKAAAEQEENYTVASWAVFASVLADVQGAIDAPYFYTTQDLLDMASALVNAQNALAPATNKSALSELIDVAEEILDDASAYIPASLANLETALAAAKTTLAAPDATQDAVDDAFASLAGALQNMYEKGDKTALDFLVQIVGSYREANYTPASWADFAAALEAAEEVIENANAVQEMVDSAYDALVDTFLGLARKADFAALNAGITLADQILANSGSYAAASLDGLADALAAAKAVQANQNATQAQVNAAASALTKEVSEARLIADMSVLSGLVAQAATLGEGSYTPESAAGLAEALGEAKALLAKGASQLAQQDVDACVAKLRAALAALAKASAPAATASAEAASPANGYCSIVEKAYEPSAAAGDASATNGVPSATAPTTATQTEGMSMQTALIIALAAAAIALATYIAWKRRKQEA
jgi:hypothetical protein